MFKPRVVKLVLFLLVAQSALGLSASKEVSAQTVKPPQREVYPASIARILLQKAFAKRLISKHDYLYFGDTVYASDVVTLSVAKLGMFGVPGKTRKVDLIFKDLDYFDIREIKQKGDRAFLVFWPKNVTLALEENFFTWEKESDAKAVRDALNSLIYQARAGDPFELGAFGERARAWRANPAARTKPSAEMDRHRVLAEQRLNEKDPFSALMEYEAGIRVNEMWPEAWFNAAILYSELELFGEAADRMKHYLALLPDAPDAQAAREKIIIWEDKAKAKEK